MKISITTEIENEQFVTWTDSIGYEEGAVTREEFAIDQLQVGVKNLISTQCMAAKEEILNIEKSQKMGIARQEVLDSIGVSVAL